MDREGRMLKHFFIGVGQEQYDVVMNDRMRGTATDVQSRSVHRIRRQLENTDVPPEPDAEMTEET